MIHLLQIGCWLISRVHQATMVGLATPCVVAADQTAGWCESACTYWLSMYAPSLLATSLAVSPWVLAAVPS
jgi:hypothetical protein